MKKTIALALIAGGLLVTVAAMAQKEPLPPKAPPEPVVLVVNFLGFSEAQAGQFVQLLEARGQAAKALAQQIGAKQKQLDNLLNGAAPDPAAIGKLLLEIRALSQQDGEILKNYHEKFVQMLTDEQKQKVGMVAQAAQLLPAVNAFIALQLVAPPFPPK